MTGRRVYIAGPISGRPDGNRVAFAAAAELLRREGHDPVNPHDLNPHTHDGDCPPSYTVAEDGHSAACYLRPCFQALLGCDQVQLLPGWEDSEGACKERSLAVWAGIPVVLHADPEQEVSGPPRGCRRCRACRSTSGSCARCGVREAVAWELCGPCDRAVEAEAVRGGQQ